MKRFIQGQDRIQSTLLPELLDEYIAEDNPVRVIDVFVDQLVLSELGVEGVNPAQTGRPSYHPSVMLKIYILNEKPAPFAQSCKNCPKYTQNL